jgi:hypothetical protein
MNFDYFVETITKSHRYFEELGEFTNEFYPSGAVGQNMIRDILRRANKSSYGK